MHGFIGLTLLWLYIFLQNSAAATEETLTCETPPQEAEAGQNLTFQCRSSHFSACLVKTDICSIINSSASCECELKNKTALAENKTVEIFNVSKSGTYKIRIITKCGHRLTYSFGLNISPRPDSIKGSRESPPKHLQNSVLVPVCICLALGFVGIIFWAFRKYHKKTQKYDQASCNPETAV